MIKTGRATKRPRVNAEKIRPPKRTRRLNLNRRAARSDAPRVRLTRAQREALEFVSQDGAEIWKRGDQTNCVFHTFVNGIERATLQALLKDECVEMIGYDTDGTWTRYAITPQGRAALRDAEEA